MADCGFAEATLKAAGAGWPSGHCNGGMRQAEGDAVLDHVVNLLGGEVSYGVECCVAFISEASTGGDTCGS